MASRFLLKGIQAKYTQNIATFINTALYLFKHPSTVSKHSTDLSLFEFSRWFRRRNVGGTSRLWEKKTHMSTANRQWYWNRKKIRK